MIYLLFSGRRLRGLWCFLEEQVCHNCIMHRMTIISFTYAHNSYIHIIYCLWWDGSIGLRYISRSPSWNITLSLCVGMCEVEPSEKGWYIKYIDRSPETLERQAVSVNNYTLRHTLDYVSLYTLGVQITRCKSLRLSVIIFFWISYVCGRSVLIMLWKYMYIIFVLLNTYGYMYIISTGIKPALCDNEVCLKIRRVVTTEWHSAALKMLFAFF